VRTTKPDATQLIWTYGISLTGYRLVEGLSWCWIPEKEPDPMETILGEIERALASGLYYLAITVSLTLPEICAALESVTGHNVRANVAFKQWYNKYLAHIYTHLTDDDCFSLRCGTVHQGRFGRPDMQYDRVIFTFPGAPTRNHRGLIQWPDVSYFSLDAEYFCRDFINAARQWFQENKDNPIVQGNLPRLVRMRPDGLPPRIIGGPLIA
jgi:hypothetical protein